MKPTELHRALVAHLAASLTDRQREALLWLPRDGSQVPADQRKRETPLYGIARKAVFPGVEAQLAQHRSELKLGAPTQWSITKLGLEVRSVLEKPQAQGSATHD